MIPFFELIILTPWYFLFYIVLCLGTGAHGYGKNITAVGAFALAFLFTPIAGMLFATASRKKEPKAKEWKSPLQKW